MNFKLAALLMGVLVSSSAIADDTKNIVINQPYTVTIPAGQGSSFLLKNGQNNFLCKADPLDALDFSANSNAAGSQLTLIVTGKVVTIGESPRVACGFGPKGRGTTFYHQYFNVTQ